MAVSFIPDGLILTIHADLLVRYGGRPGLRDPHLPESALAQATMTAGGKYLHRTLFQKAAAYGFHVCKNHPFVDGNRRVAFVLMEMFLQMNGWEMVASEEEAYSMMMALASGQHSNAELASWLRGHSARLCEH